MYIIKEVLKGVMVMDKNMKSTLIKANDVFSRISSVFMEIIRLEIERIGVYNLTAAQYIILQHLGNDRIPVGDLSLRSSYFGTNISYNVRKMVENEYIIQEKSQHDQRTHYVSISPKSKELIAKIDQALDEHGDLLHKYGIDRKYFEEILSSIGKVDDFWTYTLSSRYRGSGR